MIFKQPRGLIRAAPPMGFHARRPLHDQPYGGRLNIRKDSA